MRALRGFSLVVCFSLAFPAFGQEPLLDEFIQTANRDFFIREGKGLRMKMTTVTWQAFVGLNGPNFLASHIAPFAFSGNFEYSSSYRVDTLGLTGQPITNEGNAELSIVLPGSGGFLGINVGVRPNEKDCFNVLRISHHRNGTHYNIVTIPRKSNVGRIGFRRVGFEVIFFIRDGANAPEVEVVRYPLGVEVNVTPRLSIYRGNGPVPVPVDVLFGEMTLRADKLLRGVEARTPPAIATPPAKYNYAIDYKNNIAGIDRDFKPPGRGGNDSKVFKLEGNGLRVQPPVATVHRKDEQAHYYRESQFGIAGDFEVSVKYDVTQLGPIGPDGYGSVSVSMSFETESPLGSVSFGRGFERRGIDRYSLTRYSPTSKGHSYDTMAFPTKAKTGRMIFRRTGSELTLLALESEEARPFELVRVPFTPGPIKRVRISTDQGGSATNAVNMLISELKIKAMVVDDPQKILTATPPKNDAEKSDETTETVVLEQSPIEPQKRAGSSKIILYGAIVLVLAAVILIVVRLRGSRPSTAKK